MTDSIRDQLKKLGFKAPAPTVDQRRASAKPSARSAPAQARSKPKPPKKSAEFDLGKAYAIRSQQEKQERINAEREKQEQARMRREARQKLETLLDGRTLNDDQADIASHFEYGGKIRRVHVTAAQLSELNSGRLGVVQIRGRYLLVDAATLAEAEAIFAEAIALKVDPDAPVAADPYAESRYQVPDDLVW